MKDIGKLQFEKVLVPNFSELLIERIVKEAKKGNMNCKLDLIMHNQAIINKKLNKLLK